MLFLLIVTALFVAYVNGANDNFKGVATLYGGRVLPYKISLQWATVSTLAGSLLSLLLSAKLLHLFSGTGLVVQSVVSQPAFLSSVAAGAALTIFLATLLGFPISTTHSLVGGLVGAGVASGGLISASVLAKQFVLPLLLGPTVATAVTVCLYSIFHSVRERAGIESTFCLCVGNRQEVLVGSPGLYVVRASGLKVTVDEERHCREVYPGTFAGINIQRIVDASHILSAGAIGFARGLNDTPKITALLLMVPLLPAKTAIVTVAILMAIGGWFQSRKIAQRMSFEITQMNPGQAFTGNLVTAALVIAASLFGFPLSTTHVSCGSIFGIGLVSGKARVRTITQILLVWVTTLPLAAVLSALIWHLLKISW